MKESLLPQSLRRVRRPRILLVDDDPTVLRGLMRLLGGARPDWQVETAADGLIALQCLAEREFDVVVTDIEMPNLDGHQLLQRLAESHSGTVRIVYASRRDTPGAVSALKLADKVIEKPASARFLLEVLDAAMHRIRNPESGNGAAVS
jgi:DNA-binding NtrC family response regulator